MRDGACRCPEQERSRVRQVPGGDAILGNTRYYIPNTMVKPKSADDTTLETAWESRWSPGF